MGYQMPIVCKEVYLPCDPQFLANSPTVEEYNQHYGIDLLSIVKPVYNEELNSCEIFERPYTKIYLVLTNYGNSNLRCVRMSNQGLTMTANVSTFAFNYAFTDTENSNFGFGIAFKFEDGILDHLEFFEI